MRSSGPLGMSRIPVASTTIAPGLPRAKRSYHSMFSSVTKPSSVARQGTMAGTQVRLSSRIRPIATGLNRSALRGFLRASASGRARAST